MAGGMTPFQRLFWWWRGRTAPAAPLHQCAWDDPDPCLNCLTLQHYTPKAIDEIFTSKPLLWALRQREEEE